MKHLVTIERGCLIGHSVSLAFGLAGLLLVLPNSDFIQALPAFGMSAFGWSMANGGVAYILLGTITVSLYAYRTFGVWRWLTFMLPTIMLSLGSELLGTSTGFPFGAYGYLSGLGYKIAGLVPFTIPLSWFYVGMCCYVLARAGLERLKLPVWATVVGAITLGSILLTAWDFVLDPAMSQTPYPFWEFKEAGAFFGMPYRNLSGWFGTGAIFMAVASLFWGKGSLYLSRAQLMVPLAVYLINFAFGAIITIAQLDSRFWIPTALSASLGVIPAIALWAMAGSTSTPTLATSLQTPLAAANRGADVPPVTVGISQK
ncbi:gamma-carotene 1'-hydroxylase CruF [Myxacorys almedinensis]|uniref:Carotenoid biosynthesis protein n=1 Tax=Myxacorys almedinensis A TaxID=2690445 RepID=A0A8J8CKH4_9CYAN|nr:carotenoid biosynthesis protein [Myxacorys almedinensis]NDJ18621.1 carotenoid biosynthesis protein [Myxacorys almedinensis A]